MHIQFDQVPACMQCRFVALIHSIFAMQQHPFLIACPRYLLYLKCRSNDPHNEAGNQFTCALPGVFFMSFLMCVKEQRSCIAVTLWGQADAGASRGQPRSDRTLLYGEEEVPAGLLGIVTRLDRGKSREVWKFKRGKFKHGYCTERSRKM